MREIIVIFHNIRSAHNVGSLLRTSDGFGVEHVYFTGYTPYPKMGNDARLPHIANKLSNKIHKTALGAEDSVKWSKAADISKLLKQLKAKGYIIIGLEQTESSVTLKSFSPPAKSVLLLGSEVEGITKELLKECDTYLEIPMYGSKESFNVVQAAAIALYHLRVV